jgi:hypothetical protein
MADLAKTVLFGHNSGPFFNCSALNFNCFTAAFTYEVMMVGITTEAIDRFAIIAP